MVLDIFKVRELAPDIRIRLHKALTVGIIFVVVNIFSVFLKLPFTTSSTGKRITKQLYPDIPKNTYTLSSKNHQFLLKKYSEQYLNNSWEVEIETPIKMQTHEVTIGEFKEFVQNAQSLEELDKKYFFDKFKENSNTKNDQLPMEYVSFNDANKYAEWLNNKDGDHWRLPKVREWLAAVAQDGEEKPVLRYIDENNPKPAAINGNQMEHLLGNLRELSFGDGDSVCSEPGDIQLLGQNYFANRYSSDTVQQIYCISPTERSEGVGFRLVYEKNCLFIIIEYMTALIDRLPV